MWEDRVRSGACGGLKDGEASHRRGWLPAITLSNPRRVTAQDADPITVEEEARSVGCCFSGLIATVASSHCCERRSNLRCDLDRWCSKAKA